MNESVHREDYFVFNNVSYGIGTKVLLSHNIYNKYVFSVKEQCEPFTFIYGLNNGNKIFNCKTYGNIVVTHPEQDIEKIVYPVVVIATHTTWQQQAFTNMTHSNIHSNLFGGIILYIVIMLIGVIFVDRWLIWIFSTIIFIHWLLSQYRI